MANVAETLDGIRVLNIEKQRRGRSELLFIDLGNLELLPRLNFSSSTSIKHPTDRLIHALHLSLFWLSLSLVMNLPQRSGQDSFSVICHNLPTQKLFGAE